ncbi:MAG: CocE/NonD family hydrolase [Paraperlucidibaca sp.]|nr:CocE/NonD family hydrolase [Paraperlucidibaca sp.]MBQ0723054.1 CocE/NonD family hydrolase [Paraperlucidibaca sp.]MBQ0842712.1 CocE/NonD family hydrolase [Paraperlucidibaca sp.]
MIIRSILAISLTSLMLSACGGSSSSSDSTSPAAERQVPVMKLGTRSAESEAYGSAAPAADSAWSDYDPAPTFSSSKEIPLQFITMDDGVKLAAKVTLPSNAANVNEGPFPVILVQTSYNTSVGSFVPALGGADPFMTSHGYATVTVDVRGTGNSQGEWEAFGEREQKDYSQVVEWAATQPWSDGRIGLFGVSYLGITTVLTAQQQHPAIKAAFPIVPIGDGYRDIVFTGGQVNPTFIPLWMTLVTGLGVLPLEGIAADPATGITALLSHITGAVTNFQVPTILKALLGEQGTAADGDFWAKRSPLENAEKIKVPTFVVGGLFDLFQRSEPLWFERLKGQVPAKLLIGPWTHIQAAGIPSNGLPSDGVPELNKIQLRWFDQYVKGLPVGADRMPNVTQYVLGEERYVTSSDWPHAQMKPQQYFFQADKSLLKDQPSEKASQSIALQAPIFGLCSQSLSQWTAGIAGLLPLPCFDDDSINQNSSVVFSTPALEDDLYINGPIQANVWMTTTAQETSVSVRISDFDPATGKSRPLSNGLLSASFRAVDENRSRIIDGVMIQPWHPFTTESVLPVKPNEPMLMQVEIFPTSAKIAKGHSLKVSLSTSNLAQGLQPVLSSLIKGPLGLATFLVGPEHPSSVVLPVVPNSALAQ